MKYAEHDDFIDVLIEFMDDDVGQARHSPFISARDETDATQLRKFAETIGLGEDALDDVTCGLRATRFDIKPDGVNLAERFEREAEPHGFIDAIWS